MQEKKSEATTLEVSSVSLRELSSVYRALASLEEKELFFQRHEIAVAYLPSVQRERATAGNILQGCLAKVDQFRNRVGHQLCVFKIGLTSSPVVRFELFSSREIIPI